MGTRPEYPFKHHKNCTVSRNDCFKQCQPHTQTISRPKLPHIQPQATSSTRESTLQNPLPKSQTTTLSTNIPTTTSDTTRSINIHDPNNSTGEQLSISNSDVNYTAKFHIANIEGLISKEAWT